MKILNLNQSLADEDDLCDFGDAGHPGVANQLRIQSQQSIRCLCVAAGSGLPLDQAAGAIQLSDRVDVGYEVILFGNWSHELDLQVAARLANADTVVLAEPPYQRVPVVTRFQPHLLARAVNVLGFAARDCLEDGQHGGLVLATDDKPGAVT